ncbi:hypothetical protein [Bradyrhizobium sp.]|uniref:hypothetical protein n=1 Tax=Bradyrhizobium sp. TaxID=376 RepID=UPI000A691940|nr:hypothetical protein [Bradyrhizobium sp.]
MLRRIIVCIIALVAVTAANAQQRRQLDATPFSHAPCSVLDGRPCTPSFCSVFNDGPCIVEINFAYGQNLQLTVESAPSPGAAANYRKPSHDLNSIGDLFAALRSCWSPPPASSAREGMQMSVRLGFRRSGEVIASPRVTYATPGAPAEVRATYLKAINASLAACTPLKFTSGLGGAIAGRPIAIRYVDNRDLGRQTEKP